MRKRTLHTISLIFSLNVSISYADTIVLASDDWCPINCKAGKSPEGFMVDIAKKIFSNKGHVVEYRNIPWGRTLDMTQAGSINGAIGAYVEDCPNCIFPKNEQGLIGFQVFVTHDSSWSYDGIPSLSHITLGVAANYSYGEEIDNYIQKNINQKDKVQVLYGNTPLEQNIMKLLKSRISAVVETEPVFWYKANQLNLASQLKSAGMITSPKKAYIAFSPALANSKKYAEMLSSGMSELRKTGELNTILSNYGLVDWQK